jgi:glycosyltransferase involved in cell wall biosynthesis
MKPKVSVVIPLYNCEKWMRRAVESVLIQKLEEIELILVDDGSTDSSLDIARKYAEKDSRVIVVHQGNKGPGAARNRGIQMAKAEYVGFVDSDDYVEPEMYSELLKLAEELQVDMVMCGLKKISNVMSYIEESPLPKLELLNQDIAIGEVLPEMIGQGRFGYAAVFNKLYRKKFLEHESLLMEENRNHGEDWYFNIRVFEQLESFAVLDKTMYNYVQQNDKSLMRKYDNKRFQIYLQGYLQCKKLGEKYQIDLSEARVNFVMQSYSYMRNVVQFEQNPISFLEKTLENTELRECVQLTSKLNWNVKIIFDCGYLFGAKICCFLLKRIQAIKH